MNGKRAIVLSVFLLLFLPAAVLAQQAARERDEVEDRYKWDLSAIYADETDWDTELDWVESLVPEVLAFQGRLGESAETLLAFHKKTEEMERIFDRLYSYAGLKADEDTRVSRYHGLRQRVRSVGVEVQAATAWVQPELLLIPEEKLQGFLDGSPELEIYQHYYDDLWRSREHILSEKEERILSLAGDLSATPRDVFNQMTNADLKFGTFLDENGEEVEMTQARYGTYLESPDRRVRRDAYDVYYEGYGRYVQGSAAAFAGVLKRDLFYARARGYSSCVEASLDGDNVKPEILENLIATISANLEPVRRYYQIRKRVMGLDTLYTYDTYVPLTPELNESYSYEDAVKMIETGLKPLGSEYSKEIGKGFRSRWIDVYENAGKRAGAYSWGSSALPHPFMLMNYEGKIEDVFTLAHEMGHSMHTFYTVAEQPQVYTGIPLFTAEVASTTNEALLMDDLLRKTKDRDKKIFLLNYYIRQIMGTVYTQVMFAEFETIVHGMAESGDPITVESLGEVYRGLLEKYSGGEVTYPETSWMGWSRIPHFYRNFYVYKYATSYAAATAISEKILKKEKKAREAYLEFLESGSSDYPVEVIKKAGVDLSSPAPIQATCDLFARLVEELDRELKKKGV
ncbi:MAG: oligoendopeptidase F [Candidatus Eisenbacteria bacterium]